MQPETYTAPPEVTQPQPEPIINQPSASPVPAVPNDNFVSNPFLNAVGGIILVLKGNPVSILLLTLIAVLAYIACLGLYTLGGILGVVPMIIVTILSFVLFLVILGSFYVVGGKSARSETVTTGEAMSLAFKKSPHLFAQSLVIGLLVFVGLLLLIVPGIIVGLRLSLAPFIMFEEDLGPIKAIKRSWELTKNHATEMLGSLFAGALLSGGSGGLLSGVSFVAPYVGRYHDLKTLKDSGAEKPKIHWLNYMSYVGILLGLLVMGALVASTYAGIMDKAETTDSTSTSDFYNTTTDSTTVKYNN